MRKSFKKPIDDGDSDVKDLPVIPRPRYELVLTGELERNSDYYNELPKPRNSNSYYQQMNNPQELTRDGESRSGLCCA